MQDRDQNDSLLTRKFAYITIHSAKPDMWIRWKPNKFVSLLLCSTAAVSYLLSCIPGNCDKFVKDKAMLLFSRLYLPVVLLPFDAIMKILSTLILIQNINKSVAIFLSQPGGLKIKPKWLSSCKLLESYEVLCHSIYKKSDLHLIKGFLIQVHCCAWPLRCLHKNLLACLTPMSLRWMSHYHANGVSSFLRLIVTKQHREESIVIYWTGNTS